MNHNTRIVDIFDRSAPDYEQTGVPFFEPIGEGLVQHAELQHGDRVLDVGCGRGHVLIPAAQSVGPTGSVLGTDLAPHMLELALQRITDFGLTNARVEKGNAQFPNQADDSFDVVLAGLVLFLLDDPDKALHSYARVLKPGGRFAMSSFPPPDPLAAEILGAFIEFVESDTPSLKFSTMDSREKITDFLKPAGFANLVFAEETLHLRFSSFDTYVKWLWSHGGRVLLESIPAGTFDIAREAARRVAIRHLGGDGSLHLDWPVRYTRAALVSKPVE